MPSGNPGDYSVVFATVGLAQLEAEAIRLAATLEADGTPAQASLVRQAFLRLLSELREIAVRVAAVAEVEIKDQEISTRVRPDSGETPSLNDFVGRSNPLPGVEGSVGVNYEPDLYSNVPWWWTNEEGYGGHIGRTFIGAFTEPGFSSPARPDPARRREHPLLRIGKGPSTGKGTIQEPIPDRRFVQRGARVAEVAWHGQIRAAKTRFLRQCEVAWAAGQQIRQRRARGGRPGRRTP